MDMKIAAIKTIALAEQYDMHIGVAFDKSQSYTHLVDMKDKIINTQMSEAKIGRWLGWMQSALMTYTIYNYHPTDKLNPLSLEDFKELNRSCKC